MRRRKNSLKNKCWDEFSRYIRTRDCIASTGSSEWGLCFTCGRKNPFKKLHAGHFIQGRHLGNLFSEKGVNIQCYYCNIQLSGNTLEYRRRLIDKFGEGVDIELEEEAKRKVQYKNFQYEEMIADYKKRTEQLLKEYEDGKNNKKGNQDLRP